MGSEMCIRDRMRRDVIGLLDLIENQGTPLPHSDQHRNLVALTARILRRRLTVAELAALRTELATVLRDIQTQITNCQTDDLSIRGSQNEQHHQRSNKEESESECREEKGLCLPHSDQTQSLNLSLSVILSACFDIVQLSTHDIRDWSGLIHAADQVSPMMGIEPSVWSRAKRRMGDICAAATLAAILQRFSQIRSPGAYLQTLAAKAEAGQFSITRMIEAITRQNGPKFTAVNC